MASDSERLGIKTDPVSNVGVFAVIWLRTNGVSAAGVLLAALEECKALRAGVAPEVQTELYGLMSSDPEAGKQRMVEIAAEKGVTLTTEEVRGFLLQMDEESEFDDIELDPIALTAIAGGFYDRGGYVWTPFGRRRSC